MTNDFRFSFINLPVTLSCAGRSYTHLPIHSPGLRVTFICRMIEYSHMYLVTPSFHLHAHINPHSPLTLGLFISLPCGIHDITLNSFFPGHAKKQATVIILPN